MLVDTKLGSHIFFVDDWRTPESSYDADIINHFLTATDTEGCIEVEEVVRLGVPFTIDGCAIEQIEVQIGCMDTAEQCSVVSQIAPADRERYVDRCLVEIMVTIVVAAYTPRITTDDTMKTLDGVDDGSCSLTPEAGPARVAVVKNGVTQTVCHFTDGHTAHRGS